MISVKELFDIKDACGGGWRWLDHRIPNWGAHSNTQDPRKPFIRLFVWIGDCWSNVCPEHIQKHKLELSTGLKITTRPDTARHTSINCLPEAAGSRVITGLADCSHADLRPATMEIIWRTWLHPALTFFFFFALNHSAPPISFSGFFLFSMFAYLNLFRSSFF